MKIYKSFFFLCFALGIYSEPYAQVLYENSISDFTIRSVVLNQDRKITVSLPPNYKQSIQRYPLIVLLDGQVKPLFDLQLSAARYMSLYENSIPHAIVIAIHHVDRGRELRPFQEDSISPDFLNFLCDELLPEIQRRYRISKYRIISGHSNAAEFILYSLLKRPEVFKSYISMSPSITTDKEKFYLSLLDSAVRSGTLSKRSLILSVGGENSIDAFENSLRPSIIKLKDELRKPSPSSPALHFIDLGNKTHGQTPIFSFPEALQLAMAKAPSQSPQQFYDSLIKNNLDPVAAVRSLAQLSYAEGDEITPDANWINSLAYRYLDKKDVDNAIHVFTLGAEWYPEDANLLDSMAEALEMKGDLKKAAEYIKSGLAKYTIFEVPDLTRSVNLKEAMEEHLQSVQKKIKQ